MTEDYDNDPAWGMPVAAAAFVCIALTLLAAVVGIGMLIMKVAR